MAFAKTLVDGSRLETLENAYARICGFGCDLRLMVGSIVIAYYASKELFLSGAGPLGEPETFIIRGDQFVTAMTRAAEVPIKKALYECLATTDEFKDRPEEV